MNTTKYLIIAICMLALTTANAFSQTTTDRNETMRPNEVTKIDESKSFEEYNAVVEALQPYIQSAKTGDGKIIRTAFYDHAHIVGSIGGDFYNVDADTFEKTVAEGGESPKVQHQIAWIDISGPAAAAKVEFINWGGYRFTDFFVLYKHEGQWKISGKVYDSHSNN
jgi:hypothetical protein